MENPSAEPTRSKNFPEALSLAIAKASSGKAKFARSAGLSAAYLSHILSGYRNCTTEVLAKVLTAIGDPEDRQQLIRAFFQDLLEEVRAAIKGPSKPDLINQIDAILDMPVAEMTSSKASLGKLPRDVAAAVDKIITRAEKEPAYLALVAEMLIALAKLAPVAEPPAPLPIRRQPAPLTDD